MRLIAAIALLALLVGCRSSDRALRLPSEDLQIERSTALPHGTIPIGASPKGDRIALLCEAPDKSHQIVSVVETDSLRELGRADLPATSNSTPMFTQDGTELCLVLDEGFVAWDFRTGRRRRLDGEPAQVPLEKFLTGGGWNADRSIAIATPRKTSKRIGSKNVDVIEPGQVAVGGSKVSEIMWGSEVGFDPYGNAWWGSGRVWTKVDRTGRVQTSSAPANWLTNDQSRDRGSMHLRDTESEMTYQGSSAYVSCVWLTHDRSVPPERGKDHRAALVFAGSDLVTYGFVPGRDLVYIVTQQDSYLVNFVRTKRAP